MDKQYKTPKSLKAAFLKKKYKSKVKAQEGESFNTGTGVSGDEDDVEMAETEHTDSEAESASDYVTARKNLEYNVGQAKIAKSKGLKAKSSATEKLQKSIDKYKKLKDTDAAKKYRRKESLQEFEYSME